MKSIVVMERIWVNNGFKSGFDEGRDGVLWLKKRIEGAEVRLDSGRSLLVPWSNIKVAEL